MLRNRTSGRVQAYVAVSQTLAKNGSTEFHDNPRDVFMYVLEGQIEFILKNGKTVILNAGEHFVLPKKIRHQCTFKKLTTVLEEIYEKVL